MTCKLLPFRAKVEAVKDIEELQMTFDEMIKSHMEADALDAMSAEIERNLAKERAPFIADED